MPDQVDARLPSGGDTALEAARWLVTPNGRASIDAAADIVAAQHGGPVELAVVTALRRQGLSPAQAGLAADVAQALLKTGLHRRERPRWLTTATALEQASHPQVSRWRSQRYQGADKIWDLCAGVGFDSAALAQHAPVVAVEQDPVRATLAAANLVDLPHPVTVRHADALDVQVDPGALVHVDPGRREGHRRVFTLAQYQPPVDALLAAHSDVEGMGIVVAPGIALDDPCLPSIDDHGRQVYELEFLQVGSQLVEATAWLGALRDATAMASATIIADDHVSHRSRSAAINHVPVGDIGDLLIVVAPAAVRARLHDEIATEVGAQRVAHRRALLTGGELPEASPWYRSEIVETQLVADARHVKRWLATADVQPCEIVVHGLDVDVELWWKKLSGVLRGPSGRKIHLIRLDNGARAVITRPTS